MFRWDKCSSCTDCRRRLWGSSSRCFHSCSDIRGSRWLLSWLMVWWLWGRRLAMPQNKFVRELWGQIADGKARVPFCAVYRRWHTLLCLVIRDVVGAARPRTMKTMFNETSVVQDRKHCRLATAFCRGCSCRIQERVHAFFKGRISR